MTKNSEENLKVAIQCSEGKCVWKNNGSCVICGYIRTIVSSSNVGNCCFDEVIYSPDSAEVERNSYAFYTTACMHVGEE